MVVLAPSLFGGSLAELCGRILQAERLGEAMDGRSRIMLLCLEGKRDVTFRVCRGEMGLHEAARSFRGLEALVADTDIGLLDPYAGPSADHEAACRNVLRWVENQLRDDPRRDEVLPRLVTELRAGATQGQAP
jgi:hypothetical protein